MKLSAAIDDFIYDRETFCTNKTIFNYKNSLRYFSEFIYSYRGKNVELEDLQVDDLKKYVHFLKNRKKLYTHPYKPTEDKPITDTSIRTYLIDIRAFINYFYKSGILKDYIFKNFKLVRREKKLIIPLAVDQVDLIDNLFSDWSVSSLRNWCIVHLMLDAGFRAGEVINFSDDCFDYQHDCLIIRYGKGRKDRIVPLSKKLKVKLYSYIFLYRPSDPEDNIKKSTFLSLRKYSTCGAAPKYQSISYFTVKSLFVNIRKNTGLNMVYPHLLRHTFATSFIAGGGNLEFLRFFMGHEDIQTTSVYLHLAAILKTRGSKIYRLDDIFFQNLTY